MTAYGLSCPQLLRWLEQSPSFRVGSWNVSSGHLTGDLPAGGETDPLKWVELIKGGFQRLWSVCSPFPGFWFCFPHWSLLQSSSSLLAKSSSWPVKSTGMLNIPNKQRHPGVWEMCFHPCWISPDLSLLEQTGWPLENNRRLTDCIATWSSLFDHLH